MGQNGNEVQLMELSPLFIAFFSALAGAVSAWLLVWYKEKNKTIKERLEIVNFWTIQASNSYSLLSRIKDDFFKNPTDDPLTRCIRQNLKFHTIRIEENVANLTFVVPSTIRALAESGFENILRINALFRTINNLQYGWEERRSNLEALLATLANDHHFEGETWEISYGQITQSIGEMESLRLMKTTEQLIYDTDIALKVLSTFLKEFPKVATDGIFGGSFYHELRTTFGCRMGILNIKIDEDKLEKSLKPFPVNLEILKRFTDWTPVSEDET